MYYRPLANGQRGEVYEVNGDRVAVILDISEDRENEVELESVNNDGRKPPVYWINGMFFLLKILRSFYL